MKIDLNYGLQKNDFLTYQLFAAAKSDRIKKKRKKNWIITSIFYLGLGIIMYLLTNDLSSLVISSVVAIIWFIFYPIYSRIGYKKHYSSYIDENYKNRIGRTGLISLLDEHIKFQDVDSEGKMKYEALNEIYEISTHFFVNISTGGALILPKREIDKNTLEQAINYISNKNNQNIIKELDWKWK